MLFLYMERKKKKDFFCLFFIVCVGLSLFVCIFVCLCLLLFVVRVLSLLFGVMFQIVSTVFVFVCVWCLRLHYLT